MERRLYSSLFVTIMATALGASIVVPLLPVYAQGMGATGFQLGLIFASFALARSFLLPVVGQLADTWGRRRFMLAGLLVYTLISIGFQQSTQVWHLVVCRLIQGAAAAATIPVARAYVGDMTAPGEEGRVMGHFNMAFFGGLALGPWFGGFLKDLYGISTSFYSMGLLSLFGLVLSVMSLPKHDGQGPVSTRPRMSYLNMMKHPGLRAMFLFRFGSIIGTGVNWTFLPLFGNNELGLSATRIGILVSVTVVMTTLLQPWFGRMADRVNRPWMTFAGGVMASACLMAVPMCNTFNQLLVLNLVIGTAFGLYMPPLMAMAVDVGRETGYMTRVMSLLEMAFSMGMVVGPLLAGLIKELVGLRAIFLVGGGVGVLTCLIFIITARQSEKVAASP
jgi:DHA1 family multidrug resistance protein-like MFS transporter